MREIHRWPLNSSHKWPVTRKMFPFDYVIMYTTAITESHSSLWGNSYDHSSYDHASWRTSAKVSSGRAWLWYLHATETHIICTQYRSAICRRSWPDRISDKYVILVILLICFPAKWSYLLRCNDRNCMQQIGKHDRNCRRMTVTVGLWS